MKEYQRLEHYLSSDGAEVFKTDHIDQLNPCVQIALTEELVRAAAEGFSRPATPEFGHDVEQHLKGGDLMIVMVEGRVEGFAIRQAHPDLDTVYLAGAVKTCRAPSGIIEKITRKYLEESGLSNVVTRTQNDRVVEMVASLCEEVRPLHRPATLEDLELVANLGLLTPDMDFVNLIARRHYGEAMIASGARLRSDDPLIRALTDRLDYFAGDALLLIGHYNRKGGR